MFIFMLLILDNVNLNETFYINCFKCYRKNSRENLLHFPLLMISYFSPDIFDMKIKPLNKKQRVNHYFIILTIGQRDDKK